VSELRHRIELAILGRTAPKAAEAVLAVLAERTFTEEQWRRERNDPEAGHTFRLTATSRGSYGIVGVEGHTDAEWMPSDVEAPFRIEVRAWNLRDALKKAASLPLSAWREPGEH
jgi:hypothetical protein